MPKVVKELEETAVSWPWFRQCSLVSEMSQRLSTTEALNFVFVDDDSDLEFGR